MKHITVVLKDGTPIHLHGDGAKIDPVENALVIDDITSGVSRLVRFYWPGVLYTFEVDE